jgi:peptide chain release factor 1
MKNSIRLKLENLKDRFDEIEVMLSDAEIIADQNRFRDLS